MNIDAVEPDKGDEEVEIVIVDAEDGQTAEGDGRARDEHGRFVSGTAAVKEAQTDDPAIGIEDLKKQIAEFERRSKEAESAREDDRRALEIERRAREAAEQRAGRSQNEAADSQRSVVEARYDAITNALAAANSQLGQHKAAYQAAMEAGEFGTAANISAEIGTTAARIHNLEAGKSEIEARNRDSDSGQRAAPQESEAEQRARWIASLPPKSAAFVRLHHDRYFNDRAFASMVAGAHQLAVGRGISQDSDDYIHFIEEQTGLRKPEPVERADPEDTERAAPTSRAATSVARKSPIPAASAAGTTGDAVRNRTPQQISLTAEEREFCKLNDISEVNYAKQKRTLIEEGRVGPNAVH